jgi:hypothetical protein
MILSTFNPTKPMHHTVFEQVLSKLKPSNHLQNWVLYLDTPIWNQITLRLPCPMQPSDLTFNERQFKTNWRICRWRWLYSQNASSHWSPT